MVDRDARVIAATPAACAVLGATESALDGALVAVRPPPTVLVIDDDETMRTVVRRFLERGGYSLVESFSGRNALAKLGDGAAVHFIVTDLKMADGSGGWFMAQLGYEFPELLPRTVVISGDATGAAAAHVGARWHCPVLAKPFTAAVLVSALVELAGGAEEVARARSVGL